MFGLGCCLLHFALQHVCLSVLNAMQVVTGQAAAVSPDGNMHVQKNSRFCRSGSIRSLVLLQARYVYDWSLYSFIQLPKMPDDLPSQAFLAKQALLLIGKGDTKHRRCYAHGLRITCINNIVYAVIARAPWAVWALGAAWLMLLTNSVTCNTACRRRLVDLEPSQCLVTI